jgi:hypothetical protein
VKESRGARRVDANKDEWIHWMMRATAVGHSIAKRKVPLMRLPD